MLFLQKELNIRHVLENGFIFIKPRKNGVQNHQTGKCEVFLEKITGSQLSWHLKVPNCVHENPPLDPALSQFNSVSIFTRSPRKTNVNVAATHPLIFQEVSSFQKFACTSHISHAFYISKQSYPPWNMRCRVPIKYAVSTQSSLTYSMLDANILDLCYSSRVWESLSHPYKTTGKITVLSV
jgi:hypothetical protein